MCDTQPDGYIVNQVKGMDFGHRVSDYIHYTAGTAHTCQYMTLCHLQQYTHVELCVNFNEYIMHQHM